MDVRTVSLHAGVMVTQRMLRLCSAAASVALVGVTAWCGMASATAPQWRRDHVVARGEVSTFSRVVLTRLHGWAVGSETTQADVTRGLIERYSSAKNSWTPMPLPGNGRAGVELAGVAGDDNEAWAVGTDGQQHGVALHWKHGIWSSTAVPKANASELSAVVIVSSRDVWALGERSPRRRSIPWAIQWNGSQWRTRPFPNPGTGTASLPATAFVTDASAIPHSDSLIAVGVANGYGRGSGQMFAARLTGGHWHIVHIQPFAQAATYAYGVTAASPNRIFAAGSTDFGDTTKATVFEWNGRRWARHYIPSAAGASLTDISAAGPHSVWAVGDQGYDNGPDRPLIDHFDGVSWSTEKAAEPPRRCAPAIVQGVAARSSSSASIVGYLDCTATTAFAESRR